LKIFVLLCVYFVELCVQVSIKEMFYTQRSTKEAQSNTKRLVEGRLVKHYTYGGDTNTDMRDEDG
jgi:hypothetical protein